MLSSNLPEIVEDPEFPDRVKVFTNYRQFGAMYSMKNNWKKAEWAYATGLKQLTDNNKPAKSKDQLKTIVASEMEFRLQRAR